MTTLPVNDVFGPTFQGEGPYTGRRCYFVRLGHCNLACTWCDTPYTWDSTRYDLPTQNPQRPAEQILHRLRTLGHQPPDTVVISGGEPLMHQRRPAFTELLTGLHGTHIETNGTIPPTPGITGHIQHFTVSPKLANNAADPAHRRIRPAALEAFAELAADGRACFKFVASTLEDLDEVQALVEEHHLPPNTVWIMPEGTTADAVLHAHRPLADHILAAGFNTSTRLHTLLWNDEKSR